MNSEYSNNPLTEVALALSMAFFSIMVLTIFALSHKGKSLKSDEKISVSSSSSYKTKENKNRNIIFYFQDNFYNKSFEKWDFDKKSLNPKGYTVAVPPEISVKKLFEIRKKLKKLDIKITQQNKKWNEALYKNIKKKE